MEGCHGLEGCRVRLSWEARQRLSWEALLRAAHRRLSWEALMRSSHEKDMRVQQRGPSRG